METKEFNKSEIFRLDQEVAYNNGAIVSKQVLKKETGNVSLFSFDKGEGLSTHSAPFDAMVQLIDGRAQITIADEQYLLNAGDSIIMPANIPHAVKAIEQFKMLLTMIKSS
ncbi:MAG: cupin domain-containing protein [Bacteroidetes bacterium]|nr:cupin domain-containing protein [Bacteroidota bacterium]